MKKYIFYIIILALLLPFAVYGEGAATRDWLIDQGYFGHGGLNLDSKINRASFATLTIRLMGLEDDALNYRGQASFDDIEDFQGGWATGYISLAKEEGLLSGKSPTKFRPEGNVTYIEVLTVFMRVLGYRDRVDFANYPEDYYKKALEIGLSSMATPLNEEVLRGTVLDYMVKLLKTNLKGETISLYEKLQATPKKEDPEVRVSLENLVFNSLITGLFKGNLKGPKDFTGYRVVLLEKSGLVLGDRVLDKAGDFFIGGFNVDVLTKLVGYKYEVYNSGGKLVLSGDLK